WKTAIRSCAVVRTISTKASPPFSKSESRFIPIDKRIRKNGPIRETQNERECSRGPDKARLSQDRMVEARHRGGAARRRRHRLEVAHSPETLRKAHPGLACEMGE